MIRGEMLHGKGPSQIEIFGWEDEADGHITRHSVLVQLAQGNEPLRLRIQRFNSDGTATELVFDVQDAERLASFLRDDLAKNAPPITSPSTRKDVNHGRGTRKSTRNNPLC